MDQHKAEMSKDEKKSLKAASQSKKRKMVALILILDFGVLAVLKYFRYYLQAAGIFETGELLLPLGISFYTFQSAAYMFDLYRNKIEPDRNIAKFDFLRRSFLRIFRDLSADMISWLTSFMKDTSLIITTSHMGHSLCYGDSSRS